MFPAGTDAASSAWRLVSGGAAVDPASPSVDVSLRAGVPVWRRSVRRPCWTPPYDSSWSPGAERSDHSNRFTFLMIYYIHNCLIW